MEQRIRTKFIQYDSIGNLYCYKCGIYKPETEFDTNRNKSKMKSDLNDLTFYKFCEAIVANAAKWNKGKKKK